MNFVTYAATICKEIKKGFGEDDGVVCIRDDGNAAFAAVLDGCGGSGARTYPEAENWRGARLASAEVAQALKEWFEKSAYPLSGFKDVTEKTLSTEIKTTTDNVMQSLLSRLGKLPFGGKLMKSFPTTLSSVLVGMDGEEELKSFFAWAGDSRGYFFPVEGIQQITVDDVYGQCDAYDSLINDDVMNNVISAEEDYKINVREITITEPCILLAATDGCYSHLISPLEFEEILLDTMNRANSPEEWMTFLDREFEKRATDDYTLCLIVIGFRSFTAVKKAYFNRYENFMSMYKNLGRMRTLVEDRDNYDNMNNEKELDSLNNTIESLGKELWGRYKSYYGGT